MAVQIILYMFAGFYFALTKAIRDSVSIDGDLNNTEDSHLWHQAGWQMVAGIALFALVTRVFGCIFPVTILQDVMLIMVFSASYYFMFDPILNTRRGKPMNHLGKNPIDRALFWLSKITRTSPFIIRLIIFAGTITLTVLI